MWTIAGRASASLTKQQMFDMKASASFAFSSFPPPRPPAATAAARLPTRVAHAREDARARRRAREAQPVAPVGDDPPRRPLTKYGLDAAVGRFIMLVSEFDTAVYKRAGRMRCAYMHAATRFARRAPPAFPRLRFRDLKKSMQQSTIFDAKPTPGAVQQARRRAQVPRQSHAALGRRPRDAAQAEQGEAPVRRRGHDGRSASAGTYTLLSDMPVVPRRGYAERVSAERANAKALRQALQKTQITIGVPGSSTSMTSASYGDTRIVEFLPSRGRPARPARAPSTATRRLFDPAPRALPVVRIVVAVVVVALRPTRDDDRNA